LDIARLVKLAGVYTIYDLAIDTRAHRYDLAMVEKFELYQRIYYL